MPNSLGAVAMTDVAGAAGDYRCVLAPSAGLVPGHRYRATATIVYGALTLVVHALFALADYYGAAA